MAPLRQRVDRQHQRVQDLLHQLVGDLLRLVRLGRNKRRGLLESSL
jgi:hypothetical protein